jgi:hypothetical protein
MKSGGVMFRLLISSTRSNTSCVLPIHLQHKGLNGQRAQVQDRAGHATRPDREPPGLYNCGHTCFMNLVLQCLVHVEPLTDFMELEQFNEVFF